MIVRLYNCIWQVNSMKRDKTCKMGGGVTSQYQHSANFLRDDIIVNKSSRWRGKTWYKVATDVSWGQSPMLTQNLEVVAICRPTRTVPPLARLSSHAFCFVFFFFWKSLTFAWTALSGFRSTGSIFLFYAPNFCLDHPFGFSVHRGALYCLSRLFRFST